VDQKNLNMARVFPTEYGARLWSHMKIFFEISDYCFYRIYFFFRQRSREIAASKAAGLLGVVESLMIFDIAIFVKRFAYAFELTEQNSKLFSGIIAVIVLGFNIIRYESAGRVETIQERWNGEDKDIFERKGGLLVMFMIATIVGSILMAVI